MARQDASGIAHPRRLNGDADRRDQPAVLVPRAATDAAQARKRGHEELACCPRAAAKAVATKWISA
jgi:hypothetical protein